jgi:uncharacterized protein YjbI with pentapeptide repeats
MANKEHLALLKQGANACNEWRFYNNPIIRPDLSEANLSGANLSRTNLYKAILYRIYLN